MQFTLHIFVATVLFFSTCSVKPVSPKKDLPTAEVVRVSDGDTVTVVFQKGKIRKRIRLATIDAPEFNQPFGKKSRKSLSDLVFKKKVQILSTDTDKYGRMVAEIFVGDRNINVEQIKRGLAWHYKFHAKSQSYEKRLIYSQAEKSARRKRLGLWQLANPISPWEFRRNGKNNNRKKYKQMESPQRRKN